jgi:hypothetical protein
VEKRKERVIKHMKEYRIIAVDKSRYGRIH